MAKVRVYELAKQLGVETKEVVATLAANGIEVKSQNSIEDAAIAIVEKKFKKAEPVKKEVKEAPEKKTEAKKEAAVKEEPAKEGVKTGEKKAEHKEENARPKKKSSISAVFNAQYSKQQRPRRDGDRPRRRPDGDRQNGNRGDRSGSGRPAQGRITIRPESERTVRPSHRVQ